jgi:hypothetical protein
MDRSHYANQGTELVMASFGEAGNEMEVVARNTVLRIFRLRAMKSGGEP